MEDLIFRLRERARIRRQIPDRKSVQEGKPDRISDLLEEAADALEQKEAAVAVPDREVLIPRDLDPFDIREMRF